MSETPNATEPLTSSTAPNSSLVDSTAYDTLCGICFTDIHPVENPRGRLNSCAHLFCSYCIKEWAKNTNVCPSCKVRFTRIFTYLQGEQRDEEVKVRKRNYAAWQEESSDSGDDGDDGSGGVTSRRSSTSSGSAARVHCAVCQQSSNAARMMFCDSRHCSYVVHVECLGLVEFPLTYLCPNCAGQRVEARPSHPESGTAVPPLSSPRAPPVDKSSSHSTLTVPARAPPRKVPMQPPPSDWFQRLSEGTLSLDADPSVSAESGAGDRERHSADDRDRANPPKVPALSSPAATQASRSSAPRREAGTRPTTHDSDSSRHPSNDDLYFLAPSAHATAAMVMLHKFNDEHRHAAEVRRENACARQRRMDARSQHSLGPKRPREPSSRAGNASGALEAYAEAEFERELALRELDFSDPQLRREMEDRMTRHWAMDSMHVLRRQRAVARNRLRLDADGGICVQPPLTPQQAAAEQELRESALAQARRMVRERLDAQALALRRIRESLVRAQAQREAAALAKLARIIASRRPAARAAPQ